jgi:hypothetical protein
MHEPFAPSPPGAGGRPPPPPPHPIPHTFLLPARLKPGGHGSGRSHAQIELPFYSSVDIMRRRLLTAITYGGEGFLLR